MKYIQLYALLFIAALCLSCVQNHAEEKKDINSRQPESVISGPNSITRNIIQDRKGNIWLASWQGIFKYDGKSFTNITAKVTSARFFSILEDKKGNFWFGSIGSGVYYFDGKSFKNITIKEGLLNNDVTSIYEDREGNIWFGVYGGTSRYDGKSFQNYIINGDKMKMDFSGITFPNRPPYEVNSIIQDKNDRFWFATRGNTFIYDGNIFKVFKNNNKPFKNVRSIIEDKKGNIRIAGADGIWSYDGAAFSTFTPKFGGYIYEDKKGNIWTASESSDEKKLISLQSSDDRKWALSRYDKQSLAGKKAIPAIIASKAMIFGIMEDDKGNIWFGDFNGVHRYDGKTITDFSN